MSLHTDIAPQKAPRREETISLYSLARQELARHENDADAAEESLFERLSDDVDLLRKLVRTAVRQSVCTTVTNIIGNQRAKAFQSADPVAAKRGVEALARGLKSVLLDMPLADGTPLRDATTVEIDATATRWEKRSATMAHRARWLRGILTIVPQGRRCGEFVTERQAIQLYRDAV